MPIARTNGHHMYYEVLGQGDPVLCMGGWGTFCHDNHHHLARGLVDRWLEIFRWIHRDLGFERFPAAVTLLSFDAVHFNAHKQRLLGPAGGN